MEGIALCYKLNGSNSAVYDKNLHRGKPNLCGVKFDIHDKCHWKSLVKWLELRYFNVIPSSSWEKAVLTYKATVEAGTSSAFLLEGCNCGRRKTFASENACERCRLPQNYKEEEEAAKKKKRKRKAVDGESTTKSVVVYMNRGKYSMVLNYFQLRVSDVLIVKKSYITYI